MTEPLLRDELSEFGRGLFEAADAEAPSPGARDALLAAVAGTAAVTTALTTASAPAAAAVKGGLAAHAGASAGASVATKGAAALGAKLLVASAISVATTAVVVGELRHADVPPAPAVVATVASGSTSRPRAPSVLAPSAPEIDEPLSLEDEEVLAAEPESANVDAPTNVDGPTNVDAPTMILRGSTQSAKLHGTTAPRPEAPRDETITRSEEPDPEPSTSAPSSAPPPAPSSPREDVRDDTASAASLGAQIASIDTARAELRSGNARRALATIEAFEQRYGKNAPLSPEAMLVRVQAHLALGERRLAESAASALIREHPSSVSARRVASLVGAGD